MIMSRMVRMVVVFFLLLLFSFVSTLTVSCFQQQQTQHQYYNTNNLIFNRNVPNNNNKKKTSNHLFLLLQLQQASSSSSSSSSSSDNNNFNNNFNDNNDDNNENKQQQQQQSITTTKTKTTAPSGIYQRPSSAIERGSGFFIPGLEGPKVRVVFGIVLLFLTVLNHQLYYSVSSSFWVLNEYIAIVYSLFVLLQGAIETIKLDKQQQQEEEVLFFRNNNSKKKPKKITSSTSSSSSLLKLQQTWHIPVADKIWKQKIEWITSLYIQLTPTSNMILIGPNCKVYSLVQKNDIADKNKDNNNNGNDSNDSDDDDVIRKNKIMEEEGCKIVMETINASKSGRVALSSLNHPICTLLLGFNNNDDDNTNSSNANSNTRCVILQKVDTTTTTNTDFCWLLSSNQLLASYTKQDFLWLKQLSSYI